MSLLIFGYLNQGLLSEAYQELQAANEYLLGKVIFKKKKYFFHNTNGQLKTGKTGTHLPADTSLVQCSLFKQCSKE